MASIRQVFNLEIYMVVALVVLGLTQTTKMLKDKVVQELGAQPLKLLHRIIYLQQNPSPLEAADQVVVETEWSSWRSIVNHEKSTYK